jgi:transposase
MITVGKTIRLIFGNTAGREPAWFLISDWAGDETDPSGFSDQGILQTDGYSAYDRVGGPKIVLAACWAHARRKFFEAAKLHPKDTAATRITALLDDLFGIDARARQEDLDVSARHALRQQLAPPVLQEIRGEVQAARDLSLPASALGKAANYTLSLWKRLTRFLDYPELELSNNLAENSMRPVALGRKNWIHIGSPKAGPKVAALLTIVETCRRLQVPIREYLGDILPGLAEFPVHQVASLTPAAWVASRTPTPPASML